jgi:excisionase family DNA binding protein
MSKDNYFTTIDAAKILGFTVDYIRKLIARGKLKAYKLGNNWIIKPKDLKLVKRQRNKFSSGMEKDLNGCDQSEC